MKRACLAILLVAHTAFAGLPPDAQTHLDRGQALYDAGLFDKALAEFHAGFAVAPDPRFLYALGQTERSRGNCYAALDWYQKYLDSKPSAQGREQTQHWIDQCHASLAAQPEKVRVVEAPSWFSRHGGVALLSAAAVTLVGGGVVLGVSAAQASSAEESRTGSMPSYAAYEQKIGRAITERDVSLALLGVGTACLAGGLVWVYTHRRASEHPRVSVGLSLDGVAVGLGIPFQ
jgi:tetratricopeptide (TPR) repeat protein